MSDYPPTLYELLELISASERGRLPDSKVPDHLRNALKIGRGKPELIVRLSEIHSMLEKAPPPVWKLSREGEAVLALHRERITPSELPPEGTKFEEKDVPAAFRDGGKSDGAILTAKYLRDDEQWDLRGPYLSKHYGPGEELTTHIRVGKAQAYLYTELAALRRNKTEKF